MTAEELIQILETFDGDTPVHFGYDYNDHWHTTVAPQVNSVELQIVQHSDYHRMPKVIESYNDEEGGEQVIVLT